jgi:RHH-type transcriptional regulator, proline utilization regulon repressor / proline dehydrogenase / delta 1-pyrroline-5-carboxylate dehydrogenase
MSPEANQAAAYQAAIKAKGEMIFGAMENESQSIFSKNYWYGNIMEWSMKNDQFKTQMFRFVDVLPYLSSSGEVARHLKEYFADAGDELPSVFNFGVGLGSLVPGVMAGAVKKNVTQMAKMFITGESPDEALPILKKARKNKMTFTVDILGEACLSEVEAKEYTRKYLELIEWLAKDAQKWEHIPQIDEDNLGPIPKVNVSVKLTALDSQIDVKAFDKSKERMKERMRPVLRLAMERGVFVNVDMESYDLKDFTIAVFKDLVMEPEFKNYQHFGIVIQAYLRDSLADVKSLIEFAKKRGTHFSVRLVKGAYWDYETVHAQSMGWPVPVYTDKRESDANYEDCALVMLQNIQYVRLAAASHNVRTVAAVLVMAERLGVDPRAFEIQMLFGMADPIKKALVKQGLRVREYAPVGELIPGMAYLVRRLLENSSNQSFLRMKFAEGTSTEQLLKDPKEGLTPTSADPYSLDVKKQIRFKNEPIVDFGIEKQRANIAYAVAQVKASAGAEYPLFINGKEVKTGRFIESVNPARPSQTIGRVHVAGVAEAEAAMKAAKEAFPTWKKVSYEKRADILDKLADIFTRDRMHLDAIEILEAGKPWEEADADIAEAVDFCRYYAKEMRKIGKGQRVGGIPGETSMYHYQPRGVSVVIAPWNFPLAILTGMVAASIVTGNTCVFKPAEQTPVIGAYLMKALREAGVPAGVANFLNGYGEEIGDTLTGHKDTALICFTGSKAVGLHIWERASKHQPGQQHMKHVICEMGGKNAIVIDSDADLDEAVMGVLYSAFGFAGQKCSACSRVIVVDEIYERFTERLVEAAKSLKVLNPEEADAFVGPVIDQEAHQRILQAIETGKKEAKLAYQAPAPQEGYFVGPTIFTDVKPDAWIAQNEIFGPVLAVIRAKTFDQGIEFANNTEYGLTGGIYSRSPANIEKAKENFNVGNVYINRGITGAMVERHPFGGFKMSGAGSKTGGPDYLLNFMEPRVVTENTLRRGFAPADEYSASGGVTTGSGNLAGGV